MSLCGEALRELIDVALVEGRPAFLFVNNRLEGNSPGTIVSSSIEMSGWLVYCGFPPNCGLVAQLVRALP